MGARRRFGPADRARERPASPSRRTYSDAERETAVKLVRDLELRTGTRRGHAARVADLLGYPPRTVRHWVQRAPAAKNDAPRTRRGHTGLQADDGRRRN